ncbi:MAG: SwmB domain-containing protein, partial [Ilumatobacteraceae bacterium]
MLIVVGALIGVLMAGQVPTSATSATDPSSITVDSQGIAITLEFAESPCIGTDQPGCVPGDFNIFLGRFSVTADGTAKTINRNLATLSGRTITFNINAGGPSDWIQRGQEVVVSYTAPSGLGDHGLELVGSPNVLVASFALAATNNSTVDFTPPTLVSVVVSETRSSVVVTFDESVQLGPGATVTITVDGTGVSVGTISASESKVTLPLVSPVSSGTVVVAYQSNPPGWSDQSSNRVSDFTATATFAPQVAPQLLEGTAPSLASNGTSMTVPFDEALASAVPAPSAF